MSSVNFIFAGEVEKYKVELWNYNLDTKIDDIPLDTVYTAVGASSNYNYIVVMPLNSDIVFNSYNTDITYSMPWMPQLNLIDSVEMPGAKLIGLENSVLDNISSNPTTFAFNWLGEVSTVTPFNRVYLASSEVLNDLSKINMFSRDANGTIVTNYTMYIVNLLNIGFELSDELELGESNIVLGDKDTLIETTQLKSDSLKIDLGKITIPNSDSSIDIYSNSFELFLPFVEQTIALEPYECLGKVIGVEYVLDVYTGGLTINLYDGDTHFKSVKTTIGRNVPIKLLTEINSSLSPESGVDNPLDTAYIRRTRPELVTGDYYNLISKTGVIGPHYKGYLKVDNIELNSGAPSSVKDDIINLLSRGVIIK